MHTTVWIARRNITMFREKLGAETNAQKWRVLAELLANEECKLTEIEREEN